MDPGRWEKIKEIYHSALEIEPGRRDAFLKEACAGHESLFKEVTSLLAQDGKSEGLFESPALDAVAKAVAEEEAHKPQEDLIGRTLLHYRIEEKIGEGGMGVVYRARDTRLDRTVSLKILPAEFASDEERMRRFRRESKAASGLSHPNVAAIYDVGESEGIHYIVMEYVEGKTLDEVIRRKGMRLNEVLKYGVQIADALAAAHEAGIVHRDLKPGNLMVTAKGQVKVLDFGLAKLREQALFGPEESIATVQPSTEEGKILGTVAYMSPEQAEGKKVDTRSDIFSLGSVLYEMATGHRAFEGDNKISTLSAILRQEPKPVSSITPAIPVDLEKLIGRCLRKDPERRIQHMDDVKLALAELNEVYDSGQLQVTLPVAKRATPLLIIVVAFAAIALIAAGWYWLSRPRHAEPEAPLTAVPLTTYPGTETDPSFSPDGTQVAFQWCPEGPGQNCHIYIKQVGVEPPFQLTNAPADDWSPAWSPDGRFIAFIRGVEPKKWALILIPQRGGRERQLETWDISRLGNPPNGPYLAWTPDSKWVAFPYIQGERNNFAIFLVSVETREKRRLTTPLDDNDTAPAFSPDGRLLAFTHQELGTDLYLLHLGEGYSPQGEPKRVDTGNPWNHGAAWTPDGREIVFSSGNPPNHGLWRMEVSRPGKPVRLGFAPDHASVPSISRTGQRLAYVVGKSDINIWRVDLEGPSRRPGRPVRFISSTKTEMEPAYSPDGKRVAFVSNRTGFDEIWVCDNDGRNAEPVTSLNSECGLQGPRWSPDGERIAFEVCDRESAYAYAVNMSDRVVRRLTSQPAIWPSWSHDGQWVYFDADDEIWKVPFAGGKAVQVTRTQKGVDVRPPDLAKESPDGRFLYYQTGWPFRQSVWRIPVEGGEGVKVLDSAVDVTASWEVRQEGIYYFAPGDKGRNTLFLYQFAGGKTKKILETERSIAGLGSIGISPDGLTILYGQVDDAGSTLMLVENFR